MTSAEKTQVKVDDGADREQWCRRVAEVSAAYAALPEESRDAFVPLAAEIRRLRSELQRISASVASMEICTRCGGECCRSGRYHVTVSDVLVYLAAGVPLPAPPFTSGSCPYLAYDGCIFPPEYRPFNCITFSCDRIEGLWEPSVLAEFCRTVEALRLHRLQVADLLGGQIPQGILLD